MDDARAVERDVASPFVGGPYNHIPLLTNHGGGHTLSNGKVQIYQEIGPIEEASAGDRWRGQRRFRRQVILGFGQRAEIKVLPSLDRRWTGGVITGTKLEVCCAMYAPICHTRSKVKASISGAREH